MNFRENVEGSSESAKNVCIRPAASSYTVSRGEYGPTSGRRERTYDILLQSRSNIGIVDILGIPTTVVH